MELTACARGRQSGLRSVETLLSGLSAAAALSQSGTPSGDNCARKLIKLRRPTLRFEELFISTVCVQSRLAAVRSFVRSRRRREEVDFVPCELCHACPVAPTVMLNDAARQATRRDLEYCTMCSDANYFFLQLTNDHTHYVKAEILVT